MHSIMIQLFSVFAYEYSLPFTPSTFANSDVYTVA